MLDNNNINVPLALATARKKYEVIEILAGQKLNSLLLGVGIIPGVEIELIQNSSYLKDGIIVKVGRSRFAMGKGMALKIMVKEV
ncbi:MAG: ferrous iron transport protein A [Alphaproteobacteria bacterium]